MTPPRITYNRRQFGRLAAGAGLGIALPAVGGALWPATAFAATGGYPYATDSASDPDPWRFYKRYCTSYCAWWLNDQGVAFTNGMTGPNGVTGWFGDAHNWDDNASKIGFTTSTTPAVGTVAVWGTDYFAGFGHVAIVTRVATNGTIDVAEYNHDNSLAYGTRSGVAATSPANYIDFGVDGTNSSGAEEVWGVNSAGRIYRWNGTAWKLKPGTLAQIAVGANGVVWGVNSAGRIYRWNGTAWKLKPGTLAQISAGTNSSGAEEVWGVNSAGRIYRWNGTAWKLKPGTLAQIAVGANGVVWGVNSAGRIYRWNGTAWKLKPGTLAQISAGTNSSGAEEVWGVNSAGRIYRWNGTAWKLKPGTLAQIAVGANGVVWGVNSAGRIYRWNGSNWVRKSGALVQVSA